MKSREISFTKSFRFRIIVYSLLSLALTVLTEGIFVFLLRQLGAFGSLLQKNVISDTRAIENFFAEAGSGMGGNLNNGSNNGSTGSFGINAAKPKPDAGFRWLRHFRTELAVLIGILIVTGIVLFIVYFLLFSRRISGSLAKIAAGIENMAAGNLSTRVQIDGEDEFAMIGESLNSMALDISILMENERKNERVKNNLITNVAHDLRTPLTSVIGYLDLIVKNPDLDGETKERYMEIAYDKSLRLQKLIEDLFSYTKVSQGEVEPKLVPLDVVKLMEQMIDEFYPAFQEAGLKYEFLTTSNSIIVMADGDMLARAFSNLISNGVKYGRDGKNIRIHVKHNEQFVSIAIINYGKVIPEKDLEYIFDRFYRVESSRSEETGGTGLGLAIAKRIISMHGGSIKADSSMEGTVFEVILKIANQKGDAYERKGENMAGIPDAF